MNEKEIRDEIFKIGMHVGAALPDDVMEISTHFGRVACMLEDTSKELDLFGNLLMARRVLGLSLAIMRPQSDEEGLDRVQSLFEGVSREFLFRGTQIEPVPEEIETVLRYMAGGIKIDKASDGGIVDKLKAYVTGCENQQLATHGMVGACFTTAMAGLSQMCRNAGMDDLVRVVEEIYNLLNASMGEDNGR